MREPLLDKTYNPDDIEQSCYEQWEKAGFFEPSDQGDAFCIMIPPPNVTGSLHMGHAFQDTLMDTLVRFKRMQGKNTLWQVGTDHAGIATQMVVERQLQAQGTTRQDLGRDHFIKKIWEWKAHSGSRITQQLRRMGASVDWSRERFTMDDGLSAAVQRVFIQLYDEGLIYRGTRLVNWDPVLQTAISDLEVVSEEEKGSLWHIRYPLVNGQASVIVATTRPETLFGDVAVAVHPDDERYQALIGQQVKLPLSDRLISIIADPFVDKDFGSGCVKITPAHDFNDFAVGERHGLTPINVMTAQATLNDNVPNPYQGLDRFAARKKIVAELEAQGLLEKIEPHTSSVPRGDRSGSVLEPFLTQQWYVKIAPLAEPAIAAVERGEIRFIPDNWVNTYNAWMNNIQDWCISRQLWWGHRIPAWYDEQGHIYVADNEAAVRQKYQLADSVVLTQDNDVLDTWFSSALWPFSTLGWPEKTKELATFYPTNVLVTGFDIIFFWVARMIMFGLKFTGQVPFKEVYIHGLIRDNEGQKMSKSKGNIIDPLDLIDGIDIESLVKKRTTDMMQPQKAAQIEKSTRKHFPDGMRPHGTDALRFTFCALASTGRNIQFDMTRLEGYRNFCNKIWNAARYVMMNVSEHDLGLGDEPLSFSVADQWIQSVFQKTAQTVVVHLENYRFDLAAQAIYEFVWYEYCDWYLELCKPVLQNPQTKASLQRGTCQTLLQILEQSLCLAHPMIPFVTETIWQHVAPLLGITDKTIMYRAYPRYTEENVNNEAETAINWLKATVTSIRAIRSEMNISPAKTVTLCLKKGTAQDKQYSQKHTLLLNTLAKVSDLRWLDENEPEPVSATAVVGDLQLLIPLAGLIDVDAEKARLQKEQQKCLAERDKLQTKLDNPNYATRAPQELVQQEQERVTLLNKMMETLKDKELQLNSIQS